MKAIILSGIYLAFAVGASAAAEPTTITGIVSDSMCGAHHMMKDATAAKCTRACVKQGSDFALVVGDKVYTLEGDKSQFDKYAGQSVTVKGDMSGTKLKVSSLQASQENVKP